VNNALSLPRTALAEQKIQTLATGTKTVGRVIQTGTITT